MTAFRINSPATTGYGSVSIATPYKLCAIYTADSTDGKVTEADTFSRPDKFLHDTGYILTTGPVYDATQPSRTDQLTLSRRRHPDLAILSNHLIDRKVRANSQEEVTPQKPKGIFPGCQPNLTAKSSTLGKIRCHTCHVATKKTC